MRITNLNHPFFSFLDLRERGNLPPTVRQRGGGSIQCGMAVAVAGVIVRAVEEEGKLASFRRMGREKK